MQFETTDWRQQAAILTIPEAMVIDGKAQSAQSGRTYPVLGPRDGKVLGALPRADRHDVAQAVATARRTFEAGAWRDQPPSERKKVMVRLSELIDRDRGRVALLDTLSMGAPISVTYHHCARWAVNSLRWYGELADKLYDEVAPTASDVLALIRREPIGVVGLVLPWNWPAGLVGWKIAPALVAGNSIVLKPDEQASYSALHIAELALEAGLPEGVFNVVTGDAEAGEALGRHPDVDALAFTGSVQIGRRFLSYAAESNLKPTWLELGGKSPNIVFADAPDLETAATTAAMAIFLNSGQVCAAGSRLLVENSIREEFVVAVVAASRAYQPADPLDAGTSMGPIAKRSQFDRINAYIKAGKQEGAEIAVGGDAVLKDTGGCYIEPTIFASVDNAMRIAREEIFGPVLSVIGFDKEEEAIRIANDTHFGLAGALWTSNLSRAHRVAGAIKAGAVAVNTYAADAHDITVPFGGYKQSGFGRDKSIHAVDKYTQQKTIWINLGSGRANGARQ